MSWRNGFQLRASIRQLHYRLFQCCTYSHYSLGYGLGVGGELRDWASFEGKKILELPREVGDRFFVVFFSGACILTMRDTLAEFCRGKLHEQIAWFRGLVTWLFTSGGLLFLCICTVLHACFAKPFFERIPNSTVEQAYVHVHKIANELEMYANDVQLALNCDARGMDLVRATPILVPLKLRLRVIFLRMHRRWIHYTKLYEPGGAT